MYVHIADCWVWIIMDLLRYKYLPLNHSLTLKIRRYPNNTQTCGKLRIEQISINCCVYAVNIDVVAVPGVKIV